jgi:hypothetical protein
VVQLYSFFNLGARWDGWSTPRPGRVTPGKETRHPLCRREGWAPGPVWTGEENLAPTDIRSPDRPVCSKSLYRLSSRSPAVYNNLFVMHIRCLSSLPWQGNLVFVNRVRDISQYIDLPYKLTGLSTRTPFFLFSICNDFSFLPTLSQAS